jgi:hypothetical protein
MAKKLINIDVNEVSIVGKGAVDANYVIYKSMDEEELAKYGTSESVTRAWDTRGRGQNTGSGAGNYVPEPAPPTEQPSKPAGKVTISPQKYEKLQSEPGRDGKSVEYKQKYQTASDGAHELIIMGSGRENNIYIKHKDSPPDANVPSKMILQPLLNGIPKKDLEETIQNIFRNGDFTPGPNQSKNIKGHIDLGKEESTMTDIISDEIKKEEPTEIEKAKKDPAVDEEDVAEGEEPATDAKGGKGKGKMPPWLQKEQDDIKKEADTLRKEVEDMRKMVTERDEKLQKMEDDRLTKEFITKAQEYPYAGKAEEFGLIMKEISQKAPEAYKALEKTLGAMTAQIKEGNLFKEVGKSSGPAPTSVVGKVTELAKAKVVPGKISLEKAMDIVLRENPSLYEEYRKE